MKESTLSIPDVAHADNSAVMKRFNVRTLRSLPRSLPFRAWHAVHRSVSGVFWRISLRTFGRKSSIASPAFVLGRRWIEIGSRVSIWHSARIEAIPTAGHEPLIRIGDRTVIQPYAHIAAVESVIIGAGGLIASHVYITDHDHDFSDAEEDIVSQKRVITERVNIGNHVWLGERVIVLKGVSIGEHSVIGAGSIVTRNIPSYSLAIGAPARVVRRYDTTEHRWVKVSGP